jgi:hypothetical protein
VGALKADGVDVPFRFSVPNDDDLAAIVGHGL